MLALFYRLENMHSEIRRGLLELSDSQSYRAGRETSLCSPKHSLWMGNMVGLDVNW